MVRVSTLLATDSCLIVLFSRTKSKDFIFGALLKRSILRIKHGAQFIQSKLEPVPSLQPVAVKASEKTPKSNLNKADFWLHHSTKLEKLNAAEIWGQPDKNINSWVELK